MEKNTPPSTGEDFLSSLGERMKQGGWKEEYVRTLLVHVRELLSLGVLELIPARLAWREGTFMTDKGQAFGELRGKKLLPLLDEYIGKLARKAPEAFLDWVGDHSGNSDNAADRAFQFFWASQRSRPMDGYYWPNGMNACQLGADINHLTTAAQIWHAFTIILLSNCDFPRNDRGQRTLTVYRAVSASSIEGYQCSPFEACSLVSIASVGSSACMEYVVPHHDVWLSYFPTRQAGQNRSFFKDDGESEFIVLPSSAVRSQVNAVPLMPNKFDAQKRAWYFEEEKCFISSACMEARGLPDDCEELTVMRRFRDEYVRSLEGGELVVREYYATAPLILARIRASADATRVLTRLYSRVSRCVRLVGAGEPARAFEEYTAMVSTLQKTYLR
jgi:hypothetical protein